MEMRRRFVDLQECFPLVVAKIYDDFVRRTDDASLKYFRQSILRHKFESRKQCTFILLNNERFENILLCNYRDLQCFPNDKNTTLYVTHTLCTVPPLYYKAFHSLGITKKLSYVVPLFSSNIGNGRQFRR